MKKIIFAAAFLTFYGFSQAEEYADNQQKFDEKYFTISGIKTEISETRETSVPFEAPPEGKVAPVAAAGAIINTGATAWNVINNGAAVGNLSHYYASAMPSALTWNDVVGWKGPKEIVYTVQFENLYGMTVLDLEYVISYYYNGNKDGKGHYIANFTIKPRKFDVKWGFKFNMNLQISNPMNVGTVEDPLAYLQADLFWDLSSPIKKYKEFHTYAVRGDGAFQDISAASRELTEKISPPEEKKDAAEVNWN